MKIDPNSYFTRVELDESREILVGLRTITAVTAVAALFFGSATLSLWAAGWFVAGGLPFIATVLSSAAAHDTYQISKNIQKSSSSFKDKAFGIQLMNLIKGTSPLAHFVLDIVVMVGNQNR